MRAMAIRSSLRKAFKQTIGITRDMLDGMGIYQKEDPDLSEEIVRGPDSASRTRTSAGPGASVGGFVRDSLEQVVVTTRELIGGVPIDEEFDEEFFHDDGRNSRPSRRAVIKKSFDETLEATQELLGNLTGNDPLQIQDGIEVKPMRLTLPHMTEAFHGYRIAHISDIHMDRHMKRDFLVAIEMINQEEPDLIAITGDFVTVNAELYADDLIECLGQLQARDAVVAVLGNHDHFPWSDPEVIRRVLGQCNIIDLSNTLHTLERGDAMLHIAGVDDPSKGLDRLDLVFEHMPPRGAAILLAHAPDFADISAETRRFDLQISGHSHGGQIALPFVGARVFPKLGKKYTSGCYLVNGMIQYTNRGLGMGYPRIRYNCRPEITVYTLQALKDAPETIWRVEDEPVEETPVEEIIPPEIC